MNDQMLFHLTESINVSTEVQPLCLPSGELINQIVQPDGVNPLMLTGWDRTLANEIYLDVDIQTQKECERRWKALQADGVYENRFCATVSKENNQTRCIHRDAATIRQVDNNFYMAGQMNQLFSNNHSCTPGALYFFNFLNADTYSWIRNNVRCGSEKFTCGTGTCIPLYQLCNRFQECEDNTDEVKEFCKYLYKCPEGEFYCGLGTDDECIPDSKVNDGVKDCPNGEDEFDPPLSILQIVVGSVLAILSLVIAGLMLVKKYSSRLRKSREYLMVESEQEGIESPFKSRSNLICVEFIGEGSSGTVYKALDHTDVINLGGFAIKCVDIRFTLKYHYKHHPSASSPPWEESIGNYLINEIRILDQLNSDHVVRYYGCWAEAEDCSQRPVNKKRLERYIRDLTLSFSSTAEYPKSQVFIKMELCHFTLRDYLIGGGSQGHGDLGITDLDVIAIAKNILVGLGYVHAKGYIHRDVKPGNIFCKMGSSDVFIWKIGDFGLAAAVDRSANGNLGIAGTVEYRSPEMRRGIRYTTKTDVYSLGLVFVEIVQQHGEIFDKFNTFQELQNLEYEGRRNYLIDLTDGKFDSFVHIINQMLSVDPDERPSCEELLVGLNTIM